MSYNRSMTFIQQTKFSKWFILFSIIWTITFTVFGIESGEGNQPSADSSPLLDTIFIFASPFVMAILYYFLYKHVNKWFVFITTPLIGLAMEFLMFKPAEVLNESTTSEAALFFAIIWAVILIPPYFFTIIAQKSRKLFWLVLIGIFVMLSVAILNLML